MKAVFVCSEQIPEFGAARGDLVVVDLSDPVAPVSVIHQIDDRGLLPLLLVYEDRLDPIHFQPAALPSTPHELLARAAGYGGPTLHAAGA